MITQEFTIEKMPALLWGEKSDKLIVAVHGNQSHKQDAPLALLAQEAAPLGYQVLSFDLPQHGERVYETDFIMPDECVNELKSMYSYAANHAEKISLFGCSMGAYFELLTFSDFEIDKVWLICT